MACPCKVRIWWTAMVKFVFGHSQIIGDIDELTVNKCKMHYLVAHKMFALAIILQKQQLSILIALQIVCDSA